MVYVESGYIQMKQLGYGDSLFHLNKRPIIVVKQASM